MTCPTILDNYTVQTATTLLRIYIVLSVVLIPLSSYSPLKNVYLIEGISFALTVVKWCLIFPLSVILILLILITC